MTVAKYLGLLPMIYDEVFIETAELVRSGIHAEKINLGGQSATYKPGSQMSAHGQPITLHYVGDSKTEMAPASRLTPSQALHQLMRRAADAKMPEVSLRARQWLDHHKNLGDRELTPKTVDQALLLLGRTKKQQEAAFQMLDRNGELRSVIFRNRTQGAAGFNTLKQASAVPPASTMSPSTGRVPRKRYEMEPEAFPRPRFFAA